jgi:hypothetical protein
MAAQASGNLCKVGVEEVEGLPAVRPTGVRQNKVGSRGRFQHRLHLSFGLGSLNIFTLRGRLGKGRLGALQASQDGGTDSAIY